jgi:uncharacterized membrane protein YqiK
LWLPILLRQEAAIEQTSSEARSAAGPAAHAYKSVRQGPLAQAQHMLQQLPPGSEARAQKCHTAHGLRVLGRPSKAAAAGGDAGGAVVGELYDDADFYLTLLKDLLDDGSSAGPVAVGAKLKHTKRERTAVSKPVSLVCAGCDAMPPEATDAVLLH